MTHLLLHPYHYNMNCCPLGAFYLNRRIREIEALKPKKEHWTRLALIRVVERDELPRAARRFVAPLLRAMDAFDEPLNDRASSRSWFSRNGVYLGALGDLVSSIAPFEWDVWHRKYCGGVEPGVCHWTWEHPNIFGRRGL